MSCDDVQERLTEALLAHATPTPEDDAHAQACSSCGLYALALREVAEHLATVQVPALPPAALARWEAQSLQVLRAQRAARAPAQLRGLGLDFLRAARGARRPQPHARGHARVVAWVGKVLLGPWLPGRVLEWLAIFYFAPVALALLLLYGTIPLAVVARRRRTLEES
jgi:hypothetical protein